LRFATVFFFFSRYILQGVERIVFYNPPQFEEYYAEMVNWLPAGGSFSINCLWSSFDFLHLERIVGSKRAYQMKKSSESVIMFYDDAKGKN
jgi:U3 small nucleolar RNA-associated protein 25